MISPLRLNKQRPVKTALSFHNENKTQFLMSKLCKWGFTKPVRYLHGVPLLLHNAIIRLTKLVYVNVGYSTQSLKRFSMFV